MKKVSISFISFLLAIVLLAAPCGAATSVDSGKQSFQGLKISAASNTEEQELEASDPLTIGALFSPDDTLDPTTVTSPGGMLLMFSIYDSLATMDISGITLRMAESIESNPEATEYNIILREGLVFSNGDKVSGQDVIDSLQYLSESPMYQSIYNNIDFDESSAEDTSANIILKSPASDFIESSLSMFSPIAPGGKFDGIGAGGFVYEKGDAQTGFTLKANEIYYDGTPSIPEVTLLNVPDSSSKAKALQTGEIDYAWGLDASSVKVLQKNKDIEFPGGSLDGATALELVLNTRVAPFDDAEVRRAAKLTVDREKLVNTILGEYGVVANDMLGKGFASYPEDIEQTKAAKEEAKKIFAERGVDEFTIVCSEIVPGLTNATKMMAQDFEEVGVKVNIEELDPQSFFAQMPDLYTKSAFTFYWMNRPPMAELRSQVLKDSPYNVSGYYSDITDENFVKAVSTSDISEQEEAIYAIQQDIHANGGDLIWGYQKDISAHRTGFKSEVTQSIPWLSTASFVPEK